MKRAEQHDVDQLLTAAGPLVGQSQVEGLVVQRVELVVVEDDLLGGFGVAGLEH